MSMGGNSCVAEMLPTQIWDHLKRDSASVLIDVRTKPEWAFVGKPDISGLGRSVLCIAWADYPDMIPNPRFAEQVEESLGAADATKLFFICRSGARSMSAAQCVAQAFADKGRSVDCVNVAEGFEGDLDGEKRRGGLNGWKARGLPWVQS